MSPQSRDSCSAVGVFAAVVVNNSAICRDHYKLVVATERFPPARPGQFVQVQCSDPEATTTAATRTEWQPGAGVGTDSALLSGTRTVLRRPFSIAGLRGDERRCQIDLIHRVVGRGTAWLASLQPGDRVSLLGPLGRPFSVFPSRPLAYLVCGGMGVAPMFWLAQTLNEAGKEVHAFCGARSAELLPLTLDRGPGVDVPPLSSELTAPEFAASHTPVILATDDGTIGFRGTVVEALMEYHRARPLPAEQLVVYVCGPEAMMEAVARFCDQHQIECQVCLERLMACGVGTCQSCVVRVHDTTAPDGWRYQLCCTDGPVFDSKSICW